MSSLRTRISAARSATNCAGYSAQVQWASCTEPSTVSTRRSLRSSAYRLRAPRVSRGSKTSFDPFRISITKIWSSSASWFITANSSSSPWSSSTAWTWSRSAAFWTGRPTKRRRPRYRVKHGPTMRRSTSLPPTASPEQRGASYPRRRTSDGCARFSRSSCAGCSPFTVPTRCIAT
jgi:hypothetical protein